MFSFLLPYVLFTTAAFSAPIYFHSGNYIHPEENAVLKSISQLVGRHCFIFQKVALKHKRRFFQQFPQWSPRWALAQIRKLCPQKRMNLLFSEAIFLYHKIFHFSVVHKHVLLSHSQKERWSKGVILGS